MAHRGWRLCRLIASVSGNDMAMSSKTIATLQRVHKNQPEHLQFFRGHRKCPIVFTHVYIPKSVPTFGRHALFPSDRTHPDGESCNKQAYRNERQNVVDEIGHVGNSSVFTYVYFLFYFCSKVNTRSSPPFILGFTNSEYTTADAGCVSGERKRHIQAETHLALRDATCGGSSG